MYEGVSQLLLRRIHACIQACNFDSCLDVNGESVESSCPSKEGELV